MTRLVPAGRLPTALVRSATNGSTNNHYLGCCAVDVRRYLSSSSSSKKPEQSKVGTKGDTRIDAAATAQATAGKAPDTATADALATTPASSTPSSDQSLFDRLTAIYNENSGENELSLLKQHVTTASRQFDDAVRTVQTARLALEKATSAYDDVNKRHSALMMRRDQWDADDATAFATLTAEEVQARKALATAREALRKAEDDVSSRQVDYIDAMRRRYHEEQIWQDRWRVLGTYGTWTLIGLNSVIFLGGQFFHYRREATRLKRIEDLIREGNDSGGADFGSGVVEAVASGSKANEAGTVSEKNEEQAIENDGAPPPEVDATESIESSEATKNADDIEPSIEDDDASLLVYNDVTCPSDDESNDLMERLKKCRFSTRVRKFLVAISDNAKGIRSENKSNDIKDDEKCQAKQDYSAGNASHVLSASIEEVHWPSAAFGAVASGVGILLICMVTGRR